MPPNILANAIGRVFLVGSGPGDPGLLTLRAAHTLRNAEVLLYDALASDATIAFAPPDCERIFVGKRGGEHAMPQPEIEALMIRQARAGKRVVRLKGGDPFIFGRGGEEAQVLHAAGIPFEIVPGISSALAGPAYAGIPVTHREHNTAVTIATGHEDPTKLVSTLNWEKLADPHCTLVFVMAMSNLDAICSRLIAEGLDAATPAAVIQDATRPTQRSIVGTLATLANEAASSGLAAPAIIVVGSVVGTRADVRWFDNQPLFGKRVLITRPTHQGEDFSLALAALGADAIVAPTIRTDPPNDTSAVDRALNELATYAWVVFTSQNGVDAFFEQLKARGRDARALGSVHVACVGTKTAERLKTYGISADFVPKDFIGEALADGLIDATSAEDRILIFCAQDARDVLPQRLAEAARVPEVVAAYKTSLLREDGFAAKLARADIVTFASASAVHGFVHQLGAAAHARAASAGKVVACIGPVTAGTARELGLRVDVVADTFTTHGLLAALEAHITPNA